MICNFFSKVCTNISLEYMVIILYFSVLASNVNGIGDGIESGRCR